MIGITSQTLRFDSGLLASSLQGTAKGFAKFGRRIARKAILVEGWVSATSENMSLHVDMTAKKTAPFPPEVAACLVRMKAAHAKLPVPEAVGRRIAMPGR